MTWLRAEWAEWLREAFVTGLMLTGWVAWISGVNPRRWLARRAQEKRFPIARVVRNKPGSGQ